MAKQVIDGQKIDRKLKSRNPVIEFDSLKMYFREPYVIDCESAIGTITVIQPAIGKIVECGDKRFYSTLNIFVTNTTSHRLLLWDNGIDWNEISDFDLFCMLYKQIDNECAKLIFDDIDFNDFQIVRKNDGSISLYNEKLNIEINDDVYQHIAQYLRNVFQIFPEEKLTQSSYLKNMFIEKDRREIHNAQLKAEQGKDVNQSSIQNLISACVNHPGFKYKLSELREMGVCEFYDSVKRLQIYESSTALMKGMYSGFVDAKGISPDSYNFMRDIT